MPNFVLLLYDNPSGWQKLSPDDMQKAIEKYMAWGRKPFVVGTLRLAEDVGLGTRDLRRIEVVGTPIAQVKFDFAALRRVQRAKNTHWLV